jgi:hypothetical protein
VAAGHRVVPGAEVGRRVAKDGLSRTRASRMASTPRRSVVAGAETGHRVANNRVSRTGAYPAPSAATQRVFEDA